MTSSLHVVFRVGDGEYALPAADVVQMETFESVTPVPGAAPFVLGLVQLRGRVLPVIDLRARFGLPPIARTLDSRIIVVRRGPRLVGLLADAAREVIQLEAEQFLPPPDVVGAQVAGYVRSIAQVGARLLLQVDFERVAEPASLPPLLEDGHGQEA